MLDANQHCGNAQALEVLTNMANWVKFRVDRLPPEQMQKSLETEQGGMNEVLANLYGVTGNTNYLQLAEAFNHQRVLGSAGARRGQAGRHCTPTRKFPKSSALPGNTNSPATRSF